MFRMDSILGDEVFDDFSDLVRDIINEMGYSVEEQQLHEIEKDLRIIEENADIADPKLFSCLLDNIDDLSLFVSDPEHTLQHLATKVDFASQQPLSSQNRVMIPREFDQLITHGYERLQEVYEDIKRYEQLGMDKQNGRQNSICSNEDDQNAEAQQMVEEVQGKQMPSTSANAARMDEKENQRPAIRFGKTKPREEARLLNQFLKTNAMRRTMCPEPGRLPFKHDKQLKLEQYKREWAKNPPPGEQKRMALRWRIRELMMQREIPQLRIVTIEPLSEDETEDGLIT